MLKFLCCLCVTFSAFAEMRTIHSLDEIGIEECSDKTLILLDLDDVLIYPQDALLQQWRSGWRPEGVRAWTAEEDTIAWMHATFQLIDPLGPQFLDTLYARGIPTIGFTTFAMDQAGIVPSIPKWRAQHLNALGLHFWADREVVFPMVKGSVPPSFEQGVLYCGDGYKKDKDNAGTILAFYLNWLDWTPEKVVLVDDGQKHLDSVGRELERRGIPFLGFLYTPKALDPLDEEVATLQYQTIIDQKRWLSDEEAAHQLTAAPKP